MKKSSIPVVQSEKNLPTIKKARALTNRKLTNNLITPISLSPRSTLPPDRSSFIKSFATKQLHISEHLQTKLSSLKQIIDEKNIKIKSLEQDCLSINPNFSIRSFEKVSSPLTSAHNDESTLIFDSQELSPNFDEILKDEVSKEEVSKEEASKNKYKDLEIFKLRKKVEESSEQIKKLEKTYEESQAKLEKYEDTLELIDNCEVEINVLKSACNSEVHRIYTYINEREIEISEKMQEMEEIGEMLKKSEEKRSHNNEYNIYIESNSEKLKARVISLQKVKEKILKKILEVQEKIQQQNIVIEKLSAQIKDVQDELETEKQTNLGLYSQYETGKEAVESSLQQHETERIQFKQELESIEEQLEDTSIGPETDKKFLKQILSEKILNYSSFLEGINRKIAKLADLEKQKDELVEELEMLKKNEIYLRNQLLTKDFIIAQIDKLLQKKEESGNKVGEKGRNDGKALSDIKELIELIQPWRERFESLKEGVKCFGCKKFVKGNCEMVSPCGDVVCDKCKGGLKGECLKCGVEIGGFIESHSLHILLNSIKIEFDFLRKAQKFLGNL